jgi:hypothetical protein
MGKVVVKADGHCTSEGVTNKKNFIGGMKIDKFSNVLFVIIHNVSDSDLSSFNEPFITLAKVGQNFGHNFTFEIQAVNNIFEKRIIDTRNTGVAWNEEHHIFHGAIFTTCGDEGKG